LGDKAKEVAKVKGLEVPPHESPACLKCHVTGYDVKLKKHPIKIKNTEGISCESCHGPASDHLADGKTLRTKKDVTLNVLDNIIHPYRVSHALKLTPQVRQRARQLAEQIGVDDKLGRYANDLSQGEKQRVAICRALLPAPKLVIADEATGNLDPDNKGRILDLLFDSVGAHDATLLAVTHDHELLPRFDQVVDFLQFRQQASA
jgi:ABC-type molybdenum transport system ATPase subunit/photorepair protein PhrA